MCWFVVVVAVVYMKSDDDQQLSLGNMQNIWYDFGRELEEQAKLSWLASSFQQIFGSCCCYLNKESNGVNS